MSSNFYAAVTIILWGAMPALTKDLLNALPPFETLAISSLFAFLFLLAVNWRARSLKNLSAGKIFTAVWLGFLGLFLYSAFFYYGLERMTSQEACILNYLWPLMIILFSCPILGEKLTRRKLLAVGMSFAGVVLVMFGGVEENFSAEKIWGALSCVVAAACYGLFSVVNKFWRLEQKLAMMIIWATTAICAFLSGYLFETWLLPSVGQFIGLIWLGVLIDAVAYLTWALALEKTSNVARTANLAYLVPILAIVISTFVFGEKLSLAVIPALVLIIGGILINK
ncbi:MAG: DMT family transporter [Selenomonadaceae bacterium]|nr:DMT family transporter [Selenomonadaceae bacterium]